MGFSSILGLKNPCFFFRIFVGFHRGSTVVPPWLGAGDGAEGSPASGRDLGTAGRRRPLAADQGVGGGRLAAPGAERRGKWITLW